MSQRRGEHQHEGPGPGEDGVMYRKHTEVATAGPVGASFSVAEKNWACTKCKADNFSKRDKCFRCRARKPRVGGGLVWHEGAASSAAGIDHKWREAMDPSTRQVYYYNTETQATSWDRPAEMGMAPMGTGWYGRGKAGGNASKELVEKNTEYLKRPAPKQIDKRAGDEIAYQEGSHEFNIWFGKFQGGDRFNKESEPAENRCKVSLHAGYTRADKTNAQTAYFCMNWAKGACSKGVNCHRFHRIPTIGECGRLEKDMMHDVFGRKRHAEHREDMSGAGCFNDGCRTLFIGGLKRTPYENNPTGLQEVLEKHFGEWGEVEHCNVVWRLAIAFIRFRVRSHAECAKEAMDSQELDNGEILSIRWAREDPNPAAMAANRRANADAVVAAIKAAGHSMDKAGFDVPADYSVAEQSSSASGSKKQKRIGPNYYPNTDGQYNAEIGAAMPPPHQQQLIGNAAAGSSSGAGGSGDNKRQKTTQ